MPEGDTLFRAAAKLRDCLVGKRIEEARSQVPGLDVAVLVGSTVTSSEARGKNLLIAFDSGHTLHTHLRMNGMWYVYPRGERWRKPAVHMRVALASEKCEAVCFAAPIVRLIRTASLPIDPGIAGLGPDPLSESFDFEEAIHRWTSQTDRPLGDVVMDQRLVAGIGNILKSETLFICGADPLANMDRYSEAQVREILAEAVRVMKMNVARGANGAFLMRERSTRLGKDGGRLYVYPRTGGECHVCGGIIAMKRQGELHRSTYYCRTCQPEKRSPEAPLVSPVARKEPTPIRVFRSAIPKD